MKAFLEFGFVPNVFEYILDSGEFQGEPPYTQAREYVFEDSVFLVNGGEMFS